MESITPAAVPVASVNAPLAVSTRCPSEGAPFAGASTVDGTGRSSSVEDPPVVRRTVPPVELDGGSEKEDEVEEHRSDKDQAAANSAEVEAAVHAIEYIVDAVSHKTPCHLSPQKQIGTPAQLREPTRTPLLYSRPVTRSPTTTPEGAKREEGGENAVIFLWGSRATGAPLSP